MPISVTLPLFILIALGYIFRTKQWLKPQDFTVLNWLAYYLALPSLMVNTIGRFEFSTSFNLSLVMGNLLTMFLVCGLAVLIAHFLAPEKRGVLVMGAFRGNLGYLGIPLIMSAFGPAAVGKAGVVEGLSSPLVILLSIIVMEYFHGAAAAEKGRNLLRKRLQAIILNPIIIAALFGLFLAVTRLPLLKVTFIANLLDSLGAMALPLALLGIGGGISLKGLRWHWANVLVLALKLLVMPLVGLLIYLYIFKLTGQDLQIGVILLGMPTAVSTYVFAVELGGDAEYCASVVTLTTLFSLVTLTLWGVALAGIR